MCQCVACDYRDRMFLCNAGGGFNLLVPIQMFRKDQRTQPAHGIRIGHVDRIEADSHSPKCLSTIAVLRLRRSHGGVEGSLVIIGGLGRYEIRRSASP